MFHNFNTQYKPSYVIKDIKMLVNRSLGLDMHNINDELTEFYESSSQISSDFNMNSVPKKGSFTLCTTTASCHETEMKNRMQSSYNKISAIVNALYPKETNSIKCDKQLYSCESHEHKIGSQESLENKDSPEYFRNLKSYLPEYNMPAQQEDVNKVLESSKEDFNVSTIDMFQNKLDEIAVRNEFTSISSTYENNLNSTFITQNFNVLSSNHIESSSDNTFDGDTSKMEKYFSISEFMKKNHDVVTDKTDHATDERYYNCLSVKGKKTDSSNDISEKEKKLETMPFSKKSKENDKNSTHICSHCSKCFRYPSELNRHIRSHNLSENNSEHNEINALSDIVFKIEKNRESDETTDPSKKELRTEKCVQICPICSRIFNVPSKLARHIKTHSDLKPYECQVCSKTFLERFNLQAHVNAHRNEMPYVCNICQKSFNFKSNLTRHIRSHMKDKPFFCHDCGDAYSSEKMLAIHIRNHEEKPYKCTDCIKSFNKKSNLKRHSEIHSDKRRMYKCDLCDYAVTKNSYLKRHVANNHTK